MRFKIYERDGMKYSKLSGDNNKIHINKIFGYNSIFGETICHGTLIVNNIFKIIKLENKIKKKNMFSIRIEFLKHFKYNNEISIIKKNNIFKVYQEKKKKLEIEIKYNNNLNVYNSFRKKHNFKFKNKIFDKDKKLSDIINLLNNISRYVGTIYPGEYSIIREININYNKIKYFYGKKIEIFSKKIDRRLPIINNKLNYDNFIISFQTLERPKTKNVTNTLFKVLKDKIKKIKYNALIIGGSQGIGRDITTILKHNSKIFKIVTYNKNKILNKKKIISKKVDVLQETNTINKIIDQYSPIKVFYLVSPKISFENKLEKKTKNEYKNLFLNIPLKILEDNKFKQISFFYPSTSYIDENKNSIYSRIKLDAEKQIKRLCIKNNIPISIIRFPSINSRQSISINNPNPPSLVKYLKSNLQIINKIF